LAAMAGFAAMSGAFAVFSPAHGQVSPGADCLPETAQSAEVAEVIDGDTLRLADGTLVRLAAIEAPKRPLGGSTATPWPPADAARAALAALVAGRTVTLATIDPQSDRYGRLRAHLGLADGSWLQAVLVGRGLARVRAQSDEMPCFSALVAEENEARAAGRGLWQHDEYAIRAADDPSLRDRKGLYEIVEGRVVSVGHGRRMIFLDFGRDYRRDFTIMVNPGVAERFAETGLAVDDFAGRVVRVRGVIEESGGPAIRINDPAEVEFLDD
jgi:endonuclease YncB( thermonuclease family)